MKGEINMTPKRIAKFERVVHCRQLNLAVILENVHDPHNIGAVLRTCDAVGIKDVFLLYSSPEKKPDEIVVGKRTSAGARKWVDVHLYEDTKACFDFVKENYGKIFSTHLSVDAVGLHEMDLTQSMALMFGNEKDGLTEEALSYSDGNFLIPMKGMVESLNISVACAVTLYEAMRQRTLNGNYDDNPVSSDAQREALFETYYSRHEKPWSGKGFINLRDDNQ